jgi:hypothetical protein
MVTSFELCEGAGEGEEEEQADDATTARAMDVVRRMTYPFCMQ